METRPRGRVFFRFFYGSYKTCLSTGANYHKYKLTLSSVAVRGVDCSTKTQALQRGDQHSVTMHAFLANGTVWHADSVAHCWEQRVCGAISFFPPQPMFGILADALHCPYPSVAAPDAIEFVERREQLVSEYVRHITDEACKVRGLRSSSHQCPPTFFSVFELLGVY